VLVHNPPDLEGCGWRRLDQARILMLRGFASCPVASPHPCDCLMARGVIGVAWEGTCMCEVPPQQRTPIVISLIERELRKPEFLEKQERVIEWKAGRVRRWLVEGADQPPPKGRGLGRIPLLRGVTVLCYTPRSFFFVSTPIVTGSDLAFIVRIWHAEPKSVCIIYLNYSEHPDGQVISVRWDSQIEPFDEVIRFADRIRVRAGHRLAGFSAEWQERVKSRVSEITASASFESELALLDEDAARAVRLRPHTVIGLFLRAVALDLAEERDRLQLQLNGGQPGLNRDEAGVVYAASELAARRYFGLRASTEQVAAAAAKMQDQVRAGASRRGIANNLPGGEYVERVIRYAAGDHGAALDGIGPGVAFHICAGFVIFVIRNLDIMFELDKLICDAEALAFERGLNPPLAVLGP
jgi:hypothetical protein